MRVKPLYLPLLGQKLLASHLNYATAEVRSTDAGYSLGAIVGTCASLFAAGTVFGAWAHLLLTRGI